MPATPPNPSHRRRAAEPGELARGRAAYDERAWADAFEALCRADRAERLEPPDLERLATAAALSGHDDVHLAALERLHDRHERAGDLPAAARSAYWLGSRLNALGEFAKGSGWFARAARLLERHGADCVEQGYVAVARGLGRLFRDRDPEQALDTAREAVGIGERHRDRDLVSMARALEGACQLALGRTEAGLALLDEAMLPATSGALSPVVTGIVYCAVIGCCQRALAIDRSREWTSALAAWCDAQPQLVTFNGPCRVHRSEVLQLQGAWPEAIDEARRAVMLLDARLPREAAAAAHYQEGELLRLRGRFEDAEAAYREASRLGREPQPGLALLRLAQGQDESAATAIRQVVGAASDPSVRIRFLPAAVEIFLAVGDGAAAGAAARELEAIAAGSRNEVLEAIAAHARGAVLLAEGDARAALDPLRGAFERWQRIGAPYLAARIRALIARALDALGDREGAGLERDAARAVFRELEAAPDLERLDTAPASGRSTFGLSARELEVLRLLATGRTNRAISEQLCLSEKTIDRHVSNIFGKLDVPTRAAATAFAFRHGLLGHDG